MTTSGARCVMTTGTMPTRPLSAVRWDSPAVSHWSSPTLGKDLVKFGWTRSGASEYIMVS